MQQEHAGNIRDKIIRFCNRHYILIIIKIQTKGSSNGDPFLIATAILEDGIIVTDEGNKNNGIPMVCESLGVEYMKLNDMLDEVLE